MMYERSAPWVAIVALIVVSAYFVGLSVWALRRGKKQEGQWLAANAMAVLGMGLAPWLLWDKFANPMIPSAISFIPMYAMIYCMIQFERCRLRVSYRFTASLVALAIAFAVNGLVLVHLLEFPEDPLGVAPANLLVGGAAAAIVGVHIILHERLHKRSMK